VFLRKSGKFWGQGFFPIADFFPPLLSRPACDLRELTFFAEKHRILGPIAFMFS
jgi:hypothetical protein